MSIKRLFSINGVEAFKAIKPIIKIATYPKLVHSNYGIHLFIGEPHTGYAVRLPAFDIEEFNPIIFSLQKFYNSLILSEELAVCHVARADRNKTLCANMCDIVIKERM